MSPWITKFRVKVVEEIKTHILYIQGFGGET